MKKKIIFLILSILFSQVAIYYVNLREKDNNHSQLKDIIVDNLPYFNGLDRLYDLLSFPPIFLNLLYFEYLPIDKLIVNIGIIYLLRGLCILTTTIPKFKTCHIEHNDIQSLFSGGCYDKIFSGHIAFVITFILYLINFTDQKKYKIIYFLYIVVGSILSFITESHYSIDVLLSWIISITLFLTLNKNIDLSGIILN